MDAVQSLVPDVVIELVSQINVLTAVEAHVWQVNEHHVQFLERNQLVLAQVEEGEDTGVQLIVRAAAEVL